MRTIGHILFPFDFSAAGMAAIPYVRMLANQLRAKITILSVVPPQWVSPAALITPPAGLDPADLQQTLETHLEQLAVDGLEVPLARVTALGDPAVKIAEFARDNRVDLVMIATHGHGLFRGLLLGSVTSKVLHDVYCPVWTAAHSEKQHARELPRKVLCAIDGTAGSVALARWSMDFSRQIGASLQLLHVVRPITDWLALETEQALQEEVRAESRTRIQSNLTSAKLDLPLRVALGEVVPTITEEARQEGADLIVVGRGAMHETWGRLKTHAPGIIQRSPCPVLSV